MVYRAPHFLLLVSFCLNSSAARSQQVKEPENFRPVMKCRITWHAVTPFDWPAETHEQPFPVFRMTYNPMRAVGLNSEMAVVLNGKPDVVLRTRTTDGYIFQWNELVHLNKFFRVLEIRYAGPEEPDGGAGMYFFSFGPIQWNNLTGVCRYRVKYLVDHEAMGIRPGDSLYRYVGKPSAMKRLIPGGTDQLKAALENISRPDERNLLWIGKQFAAEAADYLAFLCNNFPCQSSVRSIRRQHQIAMQTAGHTVIKVTSPGAGNSSAMEIQCNVTGTRFSYRVNIHDEEEVLQSDYSFYEGPSLLFSFRSTEAANSTATISFPTVYPQSPPEFQLQYVDGDYVTISEGILLSK